MLGGIVGEVTIDDPDVRTLSDLIDAIEKAYPMLRGTVRDTATSRRRPFIRFFACGEDLSNEDLDQRLPTCVFSGVEPIHIVGAIAGGC